MKTPTLDSRIKKAKTKLDKLRALLGGGGKPVFCSRARMIVGAWRRIAGLQTLPRGTYSHEDEDGVHSVGDHIDELWAEATNETADAFRMAILMGDIGFVKEVAAEMSRQSRQKINWPDNRRLLMLKSYLNSPYVSPSALADEMCFHAKHTDKHSERREFSRLALKLGVTTPSKVSKRRLGQKKSKTKTKP